MWESLEIPTSIHKKGEFPNQREEGGVCMCEDAQERVSMSTRPQATEEHPTFNSRGGLNHGGRPTADHGQTRTNAQYMADQTEV